MGERQALNDLMAWNTDLRRMPYRMHSEYLRQLYLGNDLAEGRLWVGGNPPAGTTQCVRQEPRSQADPARVDRWP